MPLLELTELDSLLHSSQLKQFAIDLLHPRHGAKLGRYPQTTVTIADPGRGGGGRARCSPGRLLPLRSRLPLQAPAGAETPLLPPEGKPSAGVVPLPCAVKTRWKWVPLPGSERDQAGCAFSSLV